MKLFGGAVGGTALVGTSTGFLSPAGAATAAAALTLSLDKARYDRGDLMTLVVTENVVKPDSRSIVVTDSTGVTWKKISDDGVAPVYTATAATRRVGANTVSATLTRLSDATTAKGAASYRIGATWVPRFTGDREDRVMVGMAVTDKNNSNLQWAQATSLLAGSAQFVSVRRCFESTWITKATVDKWADWGDAQGIYPVISFKVPGNDWAGVAAGKYDNDLDVLTNTLKARKAAGRAPVCVAVHHEPSGDGNLAVWAKMQEHLSNYFAPSTGVFCFTTISNGYDWGPHLGGKGEVEAMYPASLIAAMNRNRHIVACDVYDSADATKLDYSKYDRTSLKMAGFIQWARAKGVQRIGHGEFGCHDDIDIQRCWTLINNNSDLFAYSCHFNSGQNSRADWRMIPQGYAPDPAVTSYNDNGGSAASARRLTAGRQMFNATPTGA
jgi:hypothetical protein